MIIVLTGSLGGKKASREFYWTVATLISIRLVDERAHQKKVFQCNTHLSRSVKQHNDRITF